MKILKDLWWDSQQSIYMIIFTVHSFSNRTLLGRLTRLEMYSRMTIIPIEIVQADYKKIRNAVATLIAFSQTVTEDEII